MQRQDLKFLEETENPLFQSAADLEALLGAMLACGIMKDYPFASLNLFGAPLS